MVSIGFINYIVYIMSAEKKYQLNEVGKSRRFKNKCAQRNRNFSNSFGANVRQGVWVYAMHTLSLSRCAHFVYAIERQSFAQRNVSACIKNTRKQRNQQQQQQN